MTLPANDEARSTIDEATEFLSALFGETKEPIFFQTLANDPGDADEAPNRKTILTRDVVGIDKFIKRFDRNRRGLFFCVSTIALGSPTRNKDNTRELVVAHTDLDFRSILETEPEIRITLDAIPLPPSCVVFSGGGLHLYWLLTKPLDAQANRDRIEALNRRIAVVLAGDGAATDCCRLMRLPGTTNSKRGDQRKAAVEKLDAALRYDLEDLEAWAAGAVPLLAARPLPQVKPGKGAGKAKKPKANSYPSDNPYLTLAEEQGWKPPLDVAQWLAEMTYPGNVHETQVRVSASMLKAGADPDHVVAVLLEATQAAAGDAGKRWDWKAEEAAIRIACAGAIKKFYMPTDLTDVSHADQSVTANTDTVTGNDGADGSGICYDQPAPTDKKGGSAPGVINSAGAGITPGSATKDGDAQRRPRLPKGKRPPRANATHIVLAQTVMTVLEQDGHRILFTEKGVWRYWDGLWSQMDDKALKAWLDAALEQGAQGLRLESTSRLISEARSYIIRQPRLQGRDVTFDAHGQAPTSSGLICPINRTIRPATPEDYCTWRVPFAYAPEVECPNWLTMLDDAFADRPDPVRESLKAFLQEVVGMGLVDGPKAKALCRALIFQGGSNAGKSDLIDVMAGLFGPEVIGADLTSLEGPHGMMPFVRRLPWVLHEAFDQSKWHLSSQVKAIISGEPVPINIKNGPMVSRRLGIPIFWGTNAPPQFKEATEAIINRIAVVECRRKFNADRPVGAAIAARAAGFEKPSELVLATEMSGVLAWAVEGLWRARARGYFLIPEESLQAAENVRRDSNIVAGFVKDCVTFNPNGMVSSPDFAAAFTAWWASEKGSDRRPPGSESVGRALRALADARIAADRQELRLNSRRYYAGIGLNAAGKEYWSHAVTSEAMVFAGIKASTSSESENPNQPIPAVWDSKEVVRAMRAAQAEAVTDLDAGFPGDRPMAGDRKNGHPSVTPSVTENGHPGEDLDLSEDPPF